MELFSELHPDLVGCVFSFLSMKDKRCFIQTCQYFFRIGPMLLKRHPFEKTVTLSAKELERIANHSRFSIGLKYVEITHLFCISRNIEYQKLQALLQKFLHSTNLANITSLNFYRFPLERLEPGLLPSHLSELWINNGLHASFNPTYFPAFLNNLIIGPSWNVPLTIGMLPDQLRSLTLHGFDHPLMKGVLPSNLHLLSLTRCQNQYHEEGSFPPSLHTLICLSSLFHPSCPNRLPESIEVLVLLDCYASQDSLLKILPKNLKKLITNDQSIDKSILPEGLKVCFGLSAFIDNEIKGQYTWQYNK
jgi:hypothetical protein